MLADCNVHPAGACTEDNLEVLVAVEDNAAELELKDPATAFDPVDEEGDDSEQTPDLHWGPPVAAPLRWLAAEGSCAEHAITADTLNPIASILVPDLNVDIAYLLWGMSL